MSTNLYWMPPPVEQKRNYLCLKYEIGKYFEEDYNGGTINETVGEEIIPFLKGIIAVGGNDEVESAEKLIAAIKKYGKVDLITVG